MLAILQDATIFVYKNEMEEVQSKQNGSSKSVDERDASGSSSSVYQEKVAVAPTSKDATHYRMSSNMRGHAVIFNHEHFKISGLNSRSGTQMDCLNLESMMKELGFLVTVCENYEFNQIKMKITELAREDHTNYDCLMIIVLSHGEHGMLYAKDVIYKPELLWTPFVADLCPTLAGKPKLFFFQACQGDKLDSGIHMIRTETDGQPPNHFRIPSQADFLFAYSTVPGYYSWRNTTRGSWYMQALCEELKESAHKYDLLTILTFVNRRVAVDYESNVPDKVHMHKQKQIPCVTSMLTRLVQFNQLG